MKALNVIVRFIRLVRNPNRLENVLELREAMQKMANHSRKQTMIDQFRNMPNGARWLEKEDLVLVPDLKEVQNLPEGSLGKSYFEFMTLNQLDPDSFPLDPPGSKFEFITESLKRSHDIWHTVV